MPLTPTIHKYLIKYQRVRESYLQDKYQLDKDYLFLSVNCRKLTVEAVKKASLDSHVHAKISGVSKRLYKHPN